MGNETIKPFLPEASMQATVPTGLFIVASGPEIDELTRGTSARNIDGKSLVRSTAEEGLPSEVLANARVLVLEVDPASPASLRRVAAAREARPGLPIIAALRHADLSVVRTLIHQGVTDVATLPFNPDELIPQVLEALAKLSAQTPDRPLAPMFTVIRSSGGCGATSILTHLASALAERQATKNGVCLMDLDLQSGDVAPFLSEHPQVSVMSLLDAGDRLDSDFLKNAVTQTRYDFTIISAPESITPLDAVDVDQLLKLVNLVRGQYDYLLLDLPADWTSWGLSVALTSTNVLLTTDLSVGSLRQAKKQIELLASVGIESHRIKVIVNRFESKLFKTIGLQEVSRTLERDVIASIALEPSALRSAQDQGLLITDVARKSKFASDITHLADLLTSSGEE